MPRLVALNLTDGRIAAIGDHGEVIAYGHLDVEYIPDTSAGARVNGVSFVVEPRDPDPSQHELVQEALRTRS